MFHTSDIPAILAVKFVSVRLKSSKTIMYIRSYYYYLHKNYYFLEELITYAYLEILSALNL
jgi:hypothetical protein